MDLTTLFVVTLTTSRMIMPGMPNLPMMGDFNKPTTTLTMTLTSAKSVDKNSKAECAVPEGLKLGPKVDLTIDLPKKDEQVSDGPAYDEEKSEKEEEFKFISYWKCSETVPAGQPKVLSSKEINSSIKDAIKNKDMQKKWSSMIDGMDKDKYSFAYWPGNDKKNIKKESTAPGKYVLSTNYTGKTSFILSNTQDFLAPFEVISPDKNVDLGKAIKLEWKKIPNALAYQVTAFSGKDNEMITWTSSFDPESNMGFMNEPISKAKIDELIKSGVLLSPDTTVCYIPAGIFKDTEGATVSFTAIGEDLAQTKDGITTHVLIRSNATIMLGSMEGMMEDAQVDDAIDDQDDNTDNSDDSSDSNDKSNKSSEDDLDKANKVIDTINKIFR